jgi:PAS domain S-box-containing protein
MCSFIMESVGDGVFTVDRDWNIIYFNNSAGEIIGLDPETAIGRKCWEVFKTFNCDDVCLLRPSIEEGRKIANRIMTLTRDDGREISVSVSAAPLRDQSGKVIGGVETFRDLSRTSIGGGQRGPRPVEDFCTRDPALCGVISILPQVAESDSTVLLLGESGTGKERFARAIHKLSDRRTGPFVAVNCGALPETLMESELFGYKAGAFTGANKDKPGRFRLAERGTLLLDEIGDLPLHLQSKILRVLQEKTYEPLGGVAEVVSDVRMMAATNRDLGAMVAQGSFRRDLFYRLNVVQLKLPPLRERLGDIPLLVEHILAVRRAASGKDIRGVSAEVMEVLKRHSYPGNIRELENILEYAGILCTGGLLGVEHLPADLRPSGRRETTHAPMSLREIRHKAAVAAVARHGGNRNAASRELGITKDTLRRILSDGAVGE